ncbi:MAG TPA: OB-fold domain-containing protein, partial [Candidatus Binataceae bacterium]
WQVTSGCGKVLSYTIVHWSPNPAYAAAAPYSLALIRLDEGPHMLTNIVGCPPDGVSIGMKVTVVFEQCGLDITLPKFKPET